jgi:hypothetical protein
MIPIAKPRTNPTGISQDVFDESIFVQTTPKLPNSLEQLKSPRSITPSEVETYVVTGQGNYWLTGSEMTDFSVVAGSLNSDRLSPAFITSVVPRSLDVFANSASLRTTAFFGEEAEKSFNRAQIQRAFEYLRSAAFDIDPADETYQDHVLELVDRLIARFGSSAIDAAERFIRDPRTAPVIAGAIIFGLAKVQHEDTTAKRRSVLIALLDSESPSIRYSAADALGFLKNDYSRTALRSRIPKEQNRSVLGMIKAQLR